MQPLNEYLSEYFRAQTSAMARPWRVLFASANQQQSDFKRGFVSGFLQLLEAVFVGLPVFCVMLTGLLLVGLVSGMIVMYNLFSFGNVEALRLITYFLYLSYIAGILCMGLAAISFKNGRMGHMAFCGALAVVLLILPNFSNACVLPFAKDIKQAIGSSPATIAQHGGTQLLTKSEHPVDRLEAAKSDAGLLPLTGASAATLYLPPEGLSVRDEEMKARDEEMKALIEKTFKDLER